MALLLVTLSHPFLDGGATTRSEENPPRSQVRQPLDRGWLDRLTSWGPLLCWTDILHTGQWRIQKLAWGTDCRVLQPEGRVAFEGDETACREFLQKQVRARGIEPFRGTVVVVLHGLIRSRRSMMPLVEACREHAGWTVVNVEYASARGSVEEHSRALTSVVNGLGNEVTRIHFVAHSLGNLVIRHYCRSDPDSRIGRIVMLGPPNRGAMSARLLRSQWWFTILCGEAGVQLSTAWANLEPQLVVPPFQMGVIAGGRVNGRGWDNWLLPGRDDGTVRVAETRLEGEHDRLELPLIHGTMMRDPRVIRATKHFLRTGRFMEGRNGEPAGE